MKTFHNIDEDMSGQLSKKEMLAAMGPDHMNLGMKPGDMEALLKAMDTDGDGSVSYKEFVKYLEVHDIDPDYNPFYDARERELMQLKKVAKVSKGLPPHSTSQTISNYPIPTQPNPTIPNQPRHHGSLSNRLTTTSRPSSG